MGSNPGLPGENPAALPGDREPSQVAIPGSDRGFELSASSSLNFNVVKPDVQGIKLIKDVCC